MVNECLNKEKNLEKCPCAYPGCSKKGLCCECIAYHLKRNELPACCFSKEAEATYDRSFKNFCEQIKNKQ